MIMLGLFEFWSASPWYLHPNTEQSNTHILPPDIVDPKAHFVTPWIMFLVALGRVGFGFGWACGLEWAELRVDVASGGTGLGWAELRLGLVTTVQNP